MSAADREPRQIENNERRITLPTDKNNILNDPRHLLKHRRDAIKQAQKLSFAYAASALAFQASADCNDPDYIPEEHDKAAFFHERAAELFTEIPTGTDDARHCHIYCAQYHRAIAEHLRALA